jgi:hypothetical protein
MLIVVMVMLVVGLLMVVLLTVVLLVTQGVPNPRDDFRGSSARCRRTRAGFVGPGWG